MECGCKNRKASATPQVLELGREECPVLFHTVEVAGSSADNPPEIGQYRNVLLVYKGDNAKYLFNSDGVPAALTGDIEFNSLIGRPKYAGEEMTSETDIPSVEEETAAREAADTALDGKISNVASNLAREEIARAEADARLSEEIESVDQGLATETSQRIAEDEALAGNITSLFNQVEAETTARTEGDNSLQSQIDAVVASSDVKDIVGTHAELEAYDTSTLGDKDIIKVLQDETHDDETTYYRWNTADEEFTLIGEEGPYYTKAAADTKFQDKLTAGENITINADNEISASVPEVTLYDTTGTNTDGAMTQKAATNLVYPSGQEESKNSIVIGGAASTSLGGIAIGLGARSSGSSGGQIAIGRYSKADGVYGSVVVGDSAAVPIAGYRNVAIGLAAGVGSSTPASLFDSVALGSYSKNTRNGEVSIGQGTGDSSSYRYLANLKSGELDHDAVNLMQLNERVRFASGEPTTSTEGVLGSIYNDLDTGTHYKLTSITGEGTDEDSYVYNWEIEGGSSVNVVQTTGNSEEDVMSQKAATNLVYPEGQETDKNNIVVGAGARVDTPSHTGNVLLFGTQRSGYRGVAIGKNTQAMGNDAVAIGGGGGIGQTMAAGSGTIAIGKQAYAGSAAFGDVALGQEAYAGGRLSVAIGPRTRVSGADWSVALGWYSQATRANSVSVGAGDRTPADGPVTRYITNVTDPVEAQDAATKNYVDTAVASAGANTISSEDWSTLWQ